MSNVGSEVVVAKRLVDWRTSRLVTIPMLWIRSVEASSGKRLEYVLLRIKGAQIVIEPLFDEELAKKLLDTRGRAARGVSSESK